MSRIVCALLEARKGERLTRVTGDDEIHAATPRSRVEGADVRPDRSARHRTVRHARRQDSSDRSFDLHVTDRASASSECEVEAEFDAPDPRAEREDADFGGGGT